jgi:hypothetical protein
MNKITLTTGFAGIDMTVATFRGMKLEEARTAYERFYGHQDAGGFIIDDTILKTVIYLIISDVDIEEHGVLVLPNNHVVNS